MGERAGYAENRLALVNICAEGEIDKLWGGVHYVRHRMLDTA